MKRGCACTAAALLPVAWAAASQALEFKVIVTEPAGAARKAAPLTGGLPFARGELKEVSSLALLRHGKAVPAQFVPLARWDDGSVRWALMDAQLDVEANEKVELTVADRGGNPAPPAPVRLERAGDLISIATGPMEAVISRSPGGFVSSLKVGGREMLTGTGRGLVLIDARGQPVAAGAPDETTVEHAGPVRAVVRLRGKFPGLHDGLLGYTVRLAFFAGQPRVRAHIWLENAGARGVPNPENWKECSRPEWFEFDGMAVEMGIGPGVGSAPKARCEGVEAAGRFKVFQG
ncbi:MAG: hypothetical protein N3A38_04540 [Planctomycetota bacterium]|nr:hypothetical protein [Planctomycetota bacterium]